MAQFRATIQGQRGEASRLGSKKSGLDVRINGWTGGVKVRAAHVEGEGDVFDIWSTGGSSPSGQSEYIGRVDHDGQFRIAEGFAIVVKSRAAA